MGNITADRAKCEIDISYHIYRTCYGSHFHMRGRTENYVVILTSEWKYASNVNEHRAARRRAGDVIQSIDIQLFANKSVE